MPQCIFDISPENVYEYVTQLAPETLDRITSQERVCVVPVTKHWNIVYSDLPVDRDFNISGLGYLTLPRLYGLMDTTSMDASGITAALNQPLLNVAGQGVIVGFVDTGIDYTLDSFRDGAGYTRIGTIWDQTINKSEGREDDGELPEVLYGKVYSRADINDALDYLDSGQNPYEKVPSNDVIGHGTFLAGVTAASKTKEYVGAAPQSEIAVVKLRGAKKYLRDFLLIKDEVPAYSETDIMMAVQYLVNYADSVRKPLVILIGLGTSSGARLGVSPLSEQLDDVSARKNTAVVVAMGNEANTRGHYEGKAVSDVVPDTIEINVTGSGKGFVMELWVDTLDILSVSITSPSGEQIPRIPARMGQSSEFSFLFEDSKVTVDYQISGLVLGYEIVYLRFITPQTGVWKVNVYSLTNIEGAYNSWLTLQQFMSSDAFFVRSVPETTLAGPAAAVRVISVGAYNHVTGADAAFSGRGYTADDRVKPELMAPGVDVYGPAVGGRFTTKSGTSVAAAHVAGAAALLLCWGAVNGNDVNMGSNEIKLILLRGADRDRAVQYPNPISGFGRLNLIQSFYQMRIK